MSKIESPALLDQPAPAHPPTVLPASSVDAAETLVAPEAAGARPAPLSTPRAAFWTLQASHVVIDLYPMFIAALAVTLNQRLSLTPAQYAAMFAVGPVVSGLPQAFFAWASDRFDTRLCAWFGLALGAVCLCSIGYAETFWQLILLQVIGLTGTGMYHPIGAALAGQLSHRALRHGRAWGVSIFYAAGMLGGIVGPLLSTRMTAAFGMKSLALLIPPSLLVAWVLYTATARVPHRHHGHHNVHSAVPRDEMRRRWGAVWLLFTGNIMRFIVNTGLIVLFGYWARAYFPTDTTLATNLTGNLIAALSIGMMIFGLLGGRLIRPGHEKAPMIWLSVLGAVFVALCPLAGDHIGLWAMYGAVMLSSVGFAAVIPATIALAQRLLPGRTGLASGLMLGTSWSLASIAPWYAALLLGNIPLEEIASLPAWRLDAAFGGFAVLLIVAAVLGAFMPGTLMRSVADHH